MLRAGERVICVDDTCTQMNMNLVDPDFPPFEIVDGGEYVVAWSGNYTDPFYEGEYAGVRLIGVKRPVDPVSGAEDKPFGAWRFRPVVETKIEQRIAEEVE